MEYTIDDIQWSDLDLDQTVAFLKKANDHGYTAQYIKELAFRSWRDGGYKPTFIGTAGWYVTIVPKGYESEKPFIALVSVMAYTAAKAINA